MGSIHNATRPKLRAPLIIAALMVACFAASGIYYYLHTVIHDGKLINIRRTDWTYQIDSAKVTDGVLTMKGWCFAQLEDTHESMQGLRVILRDLHDESRKWYLRAEYGLARPDVASYFTEGQDYLYCGFEVSADLEKTGIKDTDCEILIQQDDHHPDVVATGEYIIDGELCFSNPETFVNPDVQGTDLEDVVSGGDLRAYVPECGLYIYQKDWKLYILIDEDLEKERPHGDYYDLFAIGVRNSWDDFDYDIEDLSGLFSEDRSAAGMDTGHYRVMVREIPDSFPVAWLEFGLYHAQDGLDAYPRFFPRYEFNNELG